MLPLTPAPDEAAPEVAESHPASGLLAQMDLTALDIQQLLTQFYAELQAVEDAIQALELISPESRRERFPRSSRPLAVPTSGPNKVVGIHSKRR